MNRWRTLAAAASAAAVLGAVLAPGMAGSEPAPDTGASPDTNVNMVGEAYTVRQDGTFPTEVLLARYPRAVTEVSDDLSTGFASFADPGFLARFGIGAGFAGTGKREFTAPTWAECLYPQSPQTPVAETRAPGGGLGPTAVADCRSRGSHLAGYATQAAPDGARAQNLRGGPMTATVDTGAAPDGATEVVSASEINDVTIAGVVTLRSIRNRAVATTTGRPGGAVAKAEATIGAVLVNGEPVALPSDSIQALGPVLAALGPVVAPAGTFTFDVVPELVEAAADGTSASARAAQITVTLQSGQASTTFGLGYARAGARTIVNESFAGDGAGPGLGDELGDLTPAPGETPAEDHATDPNPDSPAGTESDAPLDAGLLDAGLPDAGERFGAGLPDSGAADPARLALSSPESLFLPEPALVPAPSTGTDDPAPVLPVAAPAAAAGPAGPSRSTVAVLGAICAALLVRYLSYSTKLRRL